MDTRVVAQVYPPVTGAPWHWVILEDARPTQHARTLYVMGAVRTVCGIVIREAGTPLVVTLHHSGAPDYPTCTPCLDGGMDPGLRAQIGEVVDAALRQPVTAGQGARMQPSAAAHHMDAGGSRGACSHRWHYSDPATRQADCPRCGPSHGDDEWQTH